MKLATYKDGSRDGQLVVVSRDLTQAAYASHITNRLQPVLDDWNYLSPQLQDVFDALNAGRARHAFAFDPAQCMAPLPRAYQWVQGAAYLSQDGEPLLQQCASDELAGPYTPVVAASASLGLDFEAQIAVVTSDIPRGCEPDRALDGIRLVMLTSLANLRAPERNLCTAFSPVAITTDELGAAWTKGRVKLPLQSTWNGRKEAPLDAGADMTFHFGQLIAQMAQHRNVRAGAIVGSGAVRNLGVEKKGRTEFTQYGDTQRIEMKGLDGQTLFGVIEQEVVEAAS